MHSFRPGTVLKCLCFICGEREGHYSHYKADTPIRRSLTPSDEAYLRIIESGIHQEEFMRNYGTKR